MERAMYVPPAFREGVIKGLAQSDRLSDRVVSALIPQE
jgi:hypothetical protein